MYHGLTFAPDGTCVDAPDPEFKRESCQTQPLPTFEQDGWIWVWLGDPVKADRALIPSAHGFDRPNFVVRANQLDYQANYMLINDNLTDLSHIDFVHERTLKLATGAEWSSSKPKVTHKDRGLLMERWFEGNALHPGSETLVDNWVSYRYSVPGIFVMDIKTFPAGTAQREGYVEPRSEPIAHRIEQQAVTPVNERATRYFYATGIDTTKAPAEAIEPIFSVVMAAFEEDRSIIEGQQRIIDQTDPDVPMAFIPSDKAPYQFRRIIDKLCSQD